MPESKANLSQLASRCRVLRGSYVGTFWRHTASGDIYEILGVQIREHDLEPVFQYQPILPVERVNGLERHYIGQERVDGLEWSRPVGEWLADIGKGITRYQQVQPVTTYA